MAQRQYLETYRGPVELPVAQPAWLPMIGCTIVAGIVCAVATLWSICTFTNGGCQLITPEATSIAARMF